MTNRKNRFLCIMSAMLIAAGLLTVIYPYFMRKRYVLQANQAIESFEELKAELERDDLRGLYEEMQRYNENLYAEKQKNLINAEAYEQVDFSLIERGFDNEMVAYISIPVMKIDLPVLTGGTKANMKIGAARLSQTSLPIGGNHTNTVIAAHRAPSTSDMFTHIDLLKLGDRVFVTSLFETLEYRVTETKIINPQDIEAVLIQENRDMITLVTCHPRGSNTQRYLVFAERAV